MVIANFFAPKCDVNAPGNVAGTNIQHIRLAVLTTCYNRREKTLTCLRSIKEQCVEFGLTISLYVVDDGSSDGTTEAVRNEFPSAYIIEGNGQLYWNGGMRVAFGKAQEQLFDYYLWLNDDTTLYPGALELLLEAVRNLRKEGRVNSIVVGSTRDPETGELSYGGWKSVSRINPADCVKVAPSNKIIECDTLNGNCVLIPHEVALAVGNLDSAFTHSMGDMDYGFRARQAGCSIWVAPGFVGECRLNIGKGLWSDRTVPWRDRARRVFEPKGLPPGEWFVFTKRHSGPFWPLFWVNPYAKLLWAGVREVLFGNGLNDRRQ